MRFIAFALILAIYFSSGISLTCFNKYLLSPRHYGFSFPVTLIFVHMLTNCALAGSTIVCFLRDAVRSSPFSPSRMGVGQFMKSIVPIGVLFGADITLTNVSFKYVSVSLTEVVKSAVPAILFVSNVMRGTDVSRTCLLRWLKVINVVFICLGVAFTAAGEVDFEIRGFMAAVGATIAASGKLIWIEMLLKNEGVVSKSLPAASPKQRSRSPSLNLHVNSPKSPNGFISSPSAAMGGDVSGSVRVTSPSLRQVHVLPTSESVDSLSALTSMPDELTRSSSSDMESVSIMVSGGVQSRTSAVGSPVTRRGRDDGSRSQRYMAVDIQEEGDGPHHRAANNSAKNATAPFNTFQHQHVSPPTPKGHPSSNGGIAVSPLPSASPSGRSRSSSHAHAHNHRLHPILSLFYFAPISALTLLPLQLWMEWPVLSHSPFAEAGAWEEVSALVLLGSVMAFSLNVSELFVIRETSALTLCIFGVLKFLLIIVLSVIFFDYELTILNEVGIALSVAGLIVYNYVKYEESKPGMDALVDIHSPNDEETTTTTRNTRPALNVQEAEGATSDVIFSSVGMVSSSRTIRSPAKSMHMVNGALPQSVSFSVSASSSSSSCASSSSSSSSISSCSSQSGVTLLKHHRRHALDDGEDESQHTHTSSTVAAGRSTLNHTAVHPNQNHDHDPDDEESDPASRHDPSDIGSRLLKAFEDVERHHGIDDDDDDEEHDRHDNDDEEVMGVENGRVMINGAADNDSSDIDV